MARILRFSCDDETGEADLYDNTRCTCVCPAVSNSATAGMEKSYFRSNIAPHECNCDGMVIPRIGHLINGSIHAFCRRCECKFETRNTTIIKSEMLFVRRVLLWLLLYMWCYKILQAVRLMGRQEQARYEDDFTDEERMMFGNEIDTEDDD